MDPMQLNWHSWLSLHPVGIPVIHFITFPLSATVLAPYPAIDYKGPMIPCILSNTPF